MKYLRVRKQPHFATLYAFTVKYTCKDITKIISGVRFVEKEKTEAKSHEYMIPLEFRE